MAERLADIVAQIQNVNQLEAVVRAMRGIAASRAQKGRSLLGATEAYADIISGAISQALTLLPTETAALPVLRQARPIVVMFCAEQGFAGAFTERVLNAAAGDIAGATILVIGTRGAAVASERGIKFAWSAPMATHADAIPSFADRLADALYSHIAAGAVAKVDIIFSRSIAGSGIVVDRHSLLPVDLARFDRSMEKQAPLTTLAPDVLLERLTEEYVYAQLCQAAMHAFEAENEARMMAMASAKTNIETKLTTLAQRERQVRQEEITTEIVELAAGAEALQAPSVR
jgi:F-type H+-transporting ATPase subunit gamma